MEIIKLSEKRGITALYDGDRYIIHSSYYGVVAVSKAIKRYKMKDGVQHVMDHVKIDFDICKWYGYWSLKDVISRGIKKIEREWHNTCDITYTEVEGAESHLRMRLKFDLEEY